MFSSGFTKDGDGMEGTMDVFEFLSAFIENSDMIEKGQYHLSQCSTTQSDVSIFTSCRIQNVDWLKKTSSSAEVSSEHRSSSLSI